MPSFEDPMSYPAVRGLTKVIGVTFSNFGSGCDSGRNYIWMTNPKYGDIIHPTDFSGITLDNCDEDSKVIKLNPFSAYNIHNTCKGKNSLSFLSMISP